MYYQPKDELSLRHLFSSSYAEKELKMSYLGPVLNPLGGIEDNPDCVILDKREKKWRTLTCEFKYAPSTVKEFEHNGKFQIAVVWTIKPPLTQEELDRVLKEKHGCIYPTVVLDSMGAFRNLPQYHVPEPEEFNGLSHLRDIINKKLRLGYPAIFIAYVAARTYPAAFRWDKMLDILLTRFPALLDKFPPRARGNIIGGLAQTKPVTLIKGPVQKMGYLTYRWNREDINVDTAITEMQKLIRDRGEEIPDDEIVRLVRD